MEKKKQVALPAPLFRDPIYDCPTDPVVIRSHQDNLWYMFYTQRRASDVEIGVSWVHGTRIGVATSPDGGKWLYRGTLEGLDIEPGHNTFWAPEILWAEGRYHMYVSYITGIPTDWDYPRKILHYTSSDLWNWHYESTLDLGSERVIDACVFETSPHHYRMWYKDEADNSFIHAAESLDLCSWKPLGVQIRDTSQEGPNVFILNGKIWMICDYWHGLSVYRSEDFTHWIRCSDILGESGTRPMDIGAGHHADVVVRGDRAFIFYFCHPGQGKEAAGPLERNRAVVQVAELFERDGELICDRNRDVYW